MTTFNFYRGAVELPSKPGGVRPDPTQPGDYARSQRLSDGQILWHRYTDTGAWESVQFDDLPKDLKLLMVLTT